MDALLPASLRNPAEKQLPNQGTQETMGDVVLQIGLDAKMFCFSCCERQLYPKCRAAACLRLKID